MDASRTYPACSYCGGDVPERPRIWLEIIHPRGAGLHGSDEDRLLLCDTTCLEQALQASKRPEHRSWPRWRRADA